MNCRWVDRCQTYHSVERQHGVEHLTAIPDLEAKDPVIHISVLDLSDGCLGVEWDVRACSSFVEEYGRWQRLCPEKELPR